MAEAVSCWLAAFRVYGVGLKFRSQGLGFSLAVLLQISGQPQGQQRPCHERYGCLACSASRHVRHLLRMSCLFMIPTTLFTLYASSNRLMYAMHLSKCCKCRENRQREAVRPTTTKQPRQRFRNNSRNKDKACGKQLKLS